MFRNLLQKIGGDPNKREIEKLSKIVEQINDLEQSFEALSSDALRAKTDEFKQRLMEGETLDDLLVEAFAAVREASKRTIGLRHYDIQLIGGIVLHQGKIAEMRTGEGKTLVATLPLYLNALTGRGVHLVTVNDYLARRDARWMAPIYHALGMTIGVLQMAINTDNGSSAYLVDLEKTSAVEDQNQLVKVPRKIAYLADITYGTNNEFGFDYLRDNLAMRFEDRVQRKHYYAIVDEVDNILIDEARTPLIISGPAQDESEFYVRMAQVVRQLNPEDYEIDEKSKAISLTEIGELHVEEVLGEPLRDPERPEDITPEQARLLGYLEQALRAQHLYHRNKDYLVQGGKVEIVDEFTGRLMPGRRWSEGLHQAVEAKEGVKVQPENVTYATITLQNYFRMYEKLSGMTGTAATEAEEFFKIYELEVLPIPPNLEYVALQPDSNLTELEEKDQQGYKYIYYVERSDSEQKPVFWKRQDYPDVVYRTNEAKLRAITENIFENYVKGRPTLVGTTSVDHSEILSDRLNAEAIRRLIQVLLIRQEWLLKNNAEMLNSNDPQLAVLNDSIPAIHVGDLRNLARSLGLSMNPEDPDNIRRIKEYFGFEESDTPRLIQTLQGGVIHEVLNARKHDAESQIIAGAGAFGAVTIATNMAGRGVDIKLGGEFSEDIIRDVNRVLSKSGLDPYLMSNEERQEALLNLDPSVYGIYEESVNTFLQNMKNMKRVRELGGLHVIGSERHEARRIDNQLRGRAARQGDPGSSRFYLSLEDDLMRLFGGQQVESLWKRIMTDESMPMEMRLLGRMVEQSQERVEGSNFDVRKHLLEYDDVLNDQRERIYGQRDRVFVKSDLSEDVLDMVEVELRKRIPESLADEEGPWRLLAYLNDIQPTIDYEPVYFPSFTLSVLFAEYRGILNGKTSSVEELEQVSLELAKRTLEADKDHLMLRANQMLNQVQENIDTQLQERLDTLEAYFDGRETDETDPVAAPQDPLSELSGFVRTPLKLSKEQLRQLQEGSPEVKNVVEGQIETFLFNVQLNRLIGSLERRLEESLNLRTADLLSLNWEEISRKVLDTIESVYQQRMQRLLGSDGEIARDIRPILNSLAEKIIDDRGLIKILTLMQRGTQLTFDEKTHRKGRKVYLRLHYEYLAAHYLENSEPEDVANRILDHLNQALAALEEARGYMVWNRLQQMGTTLRGISESLLTELSDEVGQEAFNRLVEVPLDEIQEQDRLQILKVLGHRLQNEVYRELLLRVISDQWVDYLTKMEALRVSIRMEAYAQRDPLVQYKGKALEMFQALLADIRMGVISRLFTYRTQRYTELFSGRELPKGNTDVENEAEIGEQSVLSNDKKRSKRHKRH